MNTNASRKINPLLIARKLPEKAKYGRLLRAYNRAKHQYEVQEKTIDIIIKTLPELCYLPVKDEGLEKKVGSVISGIRETFPAPDDRLTARLFFANFIAKGNDSDYWDLEIPEILLYLRRHRQLRTENWNKFASKAVKFASGFELAITDNNLIDTCSPTETLSLILITASFYGGLCRENALLKLISEIQSNQKIKSAFLGGKTIMWFDLVYEDKHIHNLRTDGESYRLTRWLPDTLTLGLINRYHQFKNITEDKITIFESLKNALKKLNLSLPYKNLSSFSKTSISVTENQASIELSSALVEVALDRSLSVSLPEEFWLNLVNENTNAIVNLNYSDYEAFPLKCTPNSSFSNNAASPKRVNCILKMLSESLKIKDKNRYKIGKTDVVNKLNTIANSTHKCNSV